MVRQPPAYLEFSICCRAHVMLAELRSKGDPPRWDLQARGLGPSAERDEAVLFCSRCGKTWTRPRTLVVRKDGSCYEDF